MFLKISRLKTPEYICKIFKKKQTSIGQDKLKNIPGES